MSWHGCCCDKREDAAPEVVHAEATVDSIWCSNLETLEEETQEAATEILHSEEVARRTRRLTTAEGSKSGSMLSITLKDKTLLRATDIGHVLAGCGRCLKAMSLLDHTLTADQASAMFAKSREVTGIDYFISHCWMDGRLSKVLALWIHSNLGAAFLSSACVGVTAAVLRGTDVLPASARVSVSDVHGFPYALLSGTIAFLWGLACAHHVFLALGKRSRYFFDKFCVHQAIPDQKKQAVASFGAFVGHSRRLLLLWSPFYFSRLWCTLEIAALVKCQSGDDNQDQKLPLDFLPLPLAKVSCSAWMVFAFLYLLIQFWRLLDVNTTLIDLGITAFVSLISTYVLVATLRVYARDRAKLSEQLLDFSIENADCSRDEDRIRVQRTMLGWFKTLEQCNMHVRRKVHDQVVYTLGPQSHYPTRLLIPLVWIDMLNEMDYLAAGYYKTNTDFKMTTWAGWSGFMLTLIPLSYRLCRLFARKRSTRAADFFVNASLTMVVALYGVVSYFTLRWILFYKAIPLWAGISYATSLWALFLWLQRASFGCICCTQKANVERSGRS